LKKYGWCRSVPAQAGCPAGMPAPGLSVPVQRSPPSRPSHRWGIGPPAEAASCQKGCPAYLLLSALGRGNAVFGNIGSAKHQQEGHGQIKHRDDGIDLKGLECSGIDFASRASKLN